MRGIDISEAQSSVDWQAIKDAGYEFVIIRIGYGQGHEDSMFRQFVQEAHDNGMKVGGYWFSYALNTDMAAAEGDYCRQILEDAGCLLELPVFYDQEWSQYRDDNNWDIDSATDMCYSFIASCGLNCGIYANYDWFTTVLDYDSLHSKYKIWLSQMNSKPDLECDIWQDTIDKTIVGGQPLDTNVMGE